MALFFLLACAATWWALFDDARTRTSAALQRTWRVAMTRLGRAWPRRRTPHTASRSFRHRLPLANASVRTRHLLAGMLLVLLLPALLVLALRRDVILEGFDRVERPVASARLEELLRGERLVPPPAPPPEVFLTAEVEAVRPMTASADRKWDRLDPEFTQRLLAVYRVMLEEHGYEMVLVEGYRSPERQDRLAARGQHVTRASGGRSWHQYGLAADSAFMRDGALVISERDPWAMRGYQLYGEAARQAGMVWGGDWRSIQDLMHVELRRAGVMPR
ncbi:MAG: M15 family metallopeptidase [Proteobacteria bacterium]|nr:M15 family metallopeptidase [Pseudomonadota bacterium]